MLLVQCILAQALRFEVEGPEQRKVVIVDAAHEAALWRNLACHLHDEGR